MLSRKNLHWYFMKKQKSVKLEVLWNRKLHEVKQKITIANRRDKLVVKQLVLGENSPTEKQVSVVLSQFIEPSKGQICVIVACSRVVEFLTRLLTSFRATVHKFLNEFLIRLELIFKRVTRESSRKLLRCTRGGFTHS